MDRPTVEVYERAASTYAERRQATEHHRAAAFAALDGTVLDLGCGPGLYLPYLGAPTVALDAAPSMVRLALDARPDALGVVADIAELPLARGAFAGGWASKVFQHLPATELPMALADLHRVLRTGGRLAATLWAAPGTDPTWISDDDLPGRSFTWWEPDRLRAVTEAAGFVVDRLEVVAPPPHAPADSPPRIELDATATLALPDHVGAGMTLLCCGLNPSIHAAEAGVGYVTPSNRFWRAMAAAGLASRDRDPRHLLRQHRIGMTDLVKRPTPRADELTRDEYRTGVARLESLCQWLRPASLAVVGLAGWRAAVDRRAGVGWQPEPLGPTPVYVLPSTSGLNATTSLDALIVHLHNAAAGPPG